MIQFRIARTDEELRALYRLRYEVYCHEKEYLSPEDYANAEEHDELDAYSVQIMALDPENPTEALGSFRLILDNPFGFPCEQHFRLQKKAPDSGRALEMSRLIVSPRIRRVWRYVFLGMLKEFYLYGLEHDITHCYAVVENPFLQQMRRLGLMLETIGDGAWYYNTYNVPVILDFQAYARAVQETPGKWYYEYLRAPNTEGTIRMLMARAQEVATGMNSAQQPDEPKVPVAA